MKLHQRLLALAKDPELPRWCIGAIGVGFLIAGPLDEIVIYPIVMGYIWFRKRHLLHRHGFTGLQIAAGFATIAVILTGLSFGAEIAIKLV